MSPPLVRTNFDYIMALMSLTEPFKKRRFMSTPFKGGRHIVLLRLALALASCLTLRHPLLDFVWVWVAPKYDPSYIEIILHW